MFAPRIAIHVVAPLLPIPWRVLGSAFDTMNPFGTLPAIEMWDDQAQGIAVLRRFKFSFFFEDLGVTPFHPQVDGARRSGDGNFECLRNDLID